MRVLILSSEFPPGPGGLGTHAFQLARGLHESRHDVRVLTGQNYMPESEIRGFNAAQGFKVSRQPSGVSKWRRIFMAAGALLFFRPDIVVATGDPSVYLAYLLRFLKGRAVLVAVEHGRIPPAEWEKKIKRAALRAADAVICVSQYTRKKMEQMGAAFRRSTVITNGADSRVFKVAEDSETRQLRRANAGMKVLLTVGNVTERKGQETVIRAMPLILRRVPSAHYFMIGLPTLQKELEALAGKLGVGDRVHFLGRLSQRELISWINACDLFVMLSRSGASGDFEGYGIAAVEAALCGKPAVASADSGLSEAVRHGRTGLLVSGENEAADAVIRFLENDAERISMGAQARELALTQTWEAKTSEYETYFKGLLP